MDAFYASVERLRYPQLRGLPVAIGAGHGLLEAQLAHLRRVRPERAWDAADRAHIPVDMFPRLADYAGRGVITTATYEARAFGIGSAMGLMKAARLCPQAILLPADFREYRKFSRTFKQVILQHVPVMEDRGVDEVYLDFTDAPDGQLDGGRVLAQRLQEHILQATGLSCSIGIAPNKLIAKMASEFNKPHGISVVLESELQARIWPLPCSKIGGVGPKTNARLQAHGIHTIAQLAACSRSWLMREFGEGHGAWMHDAAWGRDARPVQTHSEPVSLSRETTFERDLHVVHDRAELSAIFTELVEQLARDLQHKGYVGRTVGVKLRFDDFRIRTRAQTIDGYTNDAARIRQVAGHCLARVDLTRRLRLLGVRMGSLQRAGTQSMAATPEPPRTLPLFSAPDDEDRTAPVPSRNGSRAAT